MAGRSGFHVDLGALELDDDVSARIASRINAVVLEELARLDMSRGTVIAGRLGPGIRGLIAIRDLKGLGDIANLPQTKTLGG